ncbi:MAG: VOC family protein [Gemmatimonadota bacterium]
MEPTLGHGKICYLELPARDIAEASAFYATLFGWQVRDRGDGAVAFDDGVGEVSGTFVASPPETAVHAVFLHIMVRDVEATLEAVVQHGGAIVERPGRHLPEITARFTDPTGNSFSLYQERSLSASGA